MPIAEPHEHRPSPEDLESLRSIMQTQNRKLYRIARSIVRNDSDAEDVLQEAYIPAFTHIAAFSRGLRAFDLARPHRHQRGTQTPA